MRPALLLLIPLFAACSPGEPAAMTEGERAEIVEAIDAKLDRWMTAVQEKNPEHLRSLMTDDGSFVDFARVSEGIDDVLAVQGSLYDNFQSWDFTFDERDIEVVSGELALVERRFGIRRIHNDGRVQETDPHVLATMVFRNVAGDWRASRVHLSGAVSTVDQVEEAADYIPPPEPLEAIAATRQQLVDAIAEDDVDGIMAALSGDHLTLPPGEPMPPNNQALAQWHRQRIDNVGLEIIPGTQEVEVFGDIAVERWDSQVRASPRDGSRVIEDSNKGLWVWARQADGSWKLWLSAWNSDSGG